MEGDACASTGEFRMSNGQYYKRTSPQHSIINTLNSQNQESTLKATAENFQVA